MANPKAPADTAKQAFVGAADRPEVRLDLDMPINQLRVRDLAAILGHLSQKSPFEVGKTPIKELKLEKIENDGVFDPGSRFPPGPDPRLEHVIQALAGLTQHVSALADQVKELQKHIKR